MFEASVYGIGLVNGGEIADSEALIRAKLTDAEDWGCEIRRGKALFSSSGDWIICFKRRGRDLHVMLPRIEWMAEACYIGNSL